MPGRFSSLRERHADIDDQPGALALVAKPVERQVHADLADAAERREHQLALRPAMTLRPHQRGQHVAGRDGFGRRRRRGAAAGVRRRRSPSKRPSTLALRQRDADGLAEAGGAREPVVADRGKACAAVPLRQPRRHRGRKRGEHALGRGAHARRREVGRGKCRAGRMVHAIDADADRDRAALAFDQDAGELAAVDQARRSAISAQAVPRGPECARRPRRGAPAPRRTTVPARAPAATASVSSRLA